MWTDQLKSAFQVGGSTGFVCVRLAESFPSLRFVVQDLPNVVAGASSKVPKELSNRLTFMEHNFLTEQPVKDAAVYFFRWIFHNWSDKYCVQILRNHVPALKPGARIVIMDNCLPEPNMLHLWQDERIRYALAFRPSIDQFFISYSHL